MRKFLLTAIAVATASPAAAEGMKFGAAIPVTGRIAFVGENLIQGGEAAMAVINEAGGVLGAPITMKVEDTKGNAQSAIAAISSLIGVEKVHAILGPTSAEMMSVIDRIQDAGIPGVLIGSTAALDNAVKGETTWRLTHSDSEFGPAMALLASEKGYKNCAVVVDSLEGAQSLKVTIIPAFEKLGGTITRMIDIAPDQASYRAELLDLFADPLPECAFFEMSPDSAALFWQNASEFEELTKVNFVATDFAISGDAMASMAPVAGEAKMIALASASIGPGRETYRAAYLKRFPDEQEPALYADFMWDAVNVLSLAAQKAGSLDRAAIAAEVRNVANAPGKPCLDYAECKALLDAGEEINYEGAAGTNDVDETGNAHSGYGVFEVTTEVKQVGEISEAKIYELLDQLR